MASCFQHINECLYVVKSQLRSHWAVNAIGTDFLGRPATFSVKPLPRLDGGESAKPIGRRYVAALLFFASLKLGA